MEILFVPLLLGTADLNAAPPPPVNPPAIVRVVPAPEAAPFASGIGKTPMLKNRSHYARSTGSR